MRPFRGSDGSPYVGEAVRSSRGSVPPSPRARRVAASPARRRGLALLRSGRAPRGARPRRHPRSRKAVAVSDRALNPRQVDGFLAARALKLLPRVPDAPPRPLPGRTARQAFTAWLVSIG